MVEGISENGGDVANKALVGTGKADSAYFYEVVILNHSC
jgi:hypothetical protein